MNEPSRRHIRISDVDRSNAISTLGEHFADGRLTMTEYEERVQQATAAVSEGELEQIFSDLPKLEASRELVPTTPPAKSTACTAAAAMSAWACCSAP
ncbi:DUF1707 domain-containing protein [Corynebacterium sp.]|uniref:DUF1707 SHOCT-like domain-containing protein n=1 Tax=Corynebacterium sp. TaxID=1720 RepID=UPI0025853819|nr:DUF1707 domain-containing protein [Corynebacterium sp.]